jgi:hypothetical protein
MAMAIAGTLVFLVGVVIRLMGWGGLDERMPTQIPPRRYARLPMLIGGTTIFVGALGLLFVWLLD